MALFRVQAPVFGYQLGDVFKANKTDAQVKAALVGGHIMEVGKDEVSDINTGNYASPVDQTVEGDAHLVGSSESDENDASDASSAK